MVESEKVTAFHVIGGQIVALPFEADDVARELVNVLAQRANLGSVGPAEKRSNGARRVRRLKG